MDDNSEREKTVLTELFGLGSRLLPGGDETTQPTGDLLIDRRSYLAAAGLTTAGLAGCADLDGGATVRPVSAFGYGGTQTLRQTSTLSVTESEPNDRQAGADAVTTGATVTGTLTPSDSDWFTVELSAGKEVVVEFTREAPSGVTAVILYDPDGVFSTLRYVATDQPVTMTQTVEQTGRYFLQVVDTQDSDGSYTLTVGDGTAPTETATPVETETATPVETETATPVETETATPVVTETATPTATETATPTEDDYGEQGYGEYGYGGVAP